MVLIFKELHVAKKEKFKIFDNENLKKKLLGCVKKYQKFLIDYDFIHIFILRASITAVAINNCKH
jgi:hypothetical protein